MLSPRSELILKLIIEDFIKTAEPVGSKYLSDTYKIGVSPATIRNEMAILEKEGFLRQPHTSAGRVPTEAAYEYYLKYLRNKKFVLKGQPLTCVAKKTNEDTKASIKNVAKQLAEVSGEAAIVAFDPRWSYYVGVSNLFQKPDFQDAGLLLTLSEMVDQFDDVIRKLYPTISEEPQILIGSSNPFGDQMAAIITKYEFEGACHGIVGVVGPLRMNYERNLALVNRARDVIQELYG